MSLGALGVQLGFSPNPFTTNLAGLNNAIRFETNVVSHFYIVIGDESGYWICCTSDYSFVDPGLLILDSWHHVALVWGDEGREFSGYFDGIEVFNTINDQETCAIRTGGNGSPQVICLPLFPTKFPDAHIGGGLQPVPKRYWRGLVDEVKIYQRALGADGIKDVYIAVNPTGQQYAVTVRTSYKGSQQSAVVMVAVGN